MLRGLLAGCEYRDIGFLVDSSGSIVENAGVNTFQLMKHFVTRIISRFDVGQGKNLVGLVQFSETAETVFTFSTYANSSKADIYRAVDEMTGLGQNTNTALGLRLFTTLNDLIFRSCFYAKISKRLIGKIK